MLDPHRVLVLRTSEPLDHVEAVAELWEDIRGSDAPVLFKPNLINHRHLLDGDVRAVVTQPQVLELAWQVADALGLNGRRGVADAPQGDADFAALLEVTGLDDWARNRGVTIADLRSVRWDHKHFIPTARHVLSGDPAGAVHVDLGELSAFHGVTGRRYYGADFDIDYTNENHTNGRHIYAFSGTALQSGIVLNLPKMKTHKKAGVTLSLKNLVGLNADKNLLPHHSLGTPAEGGDAYDSSQAKQRVEAKVIEAVKPLLARWVGLARHVAFLRPLAEQVFGTTQDVIRSGNWYGNDTLWRMIHDLNRILIYATTDGEIARERQRTTFSLVDGIIAGEGRGPEAPDPVQANLLIAGTDFVAVDIVAATLMGFDYTKIPHLAHAFDEHELPLTTIDPDSIAIESNIPEWNGALRGLPPKAIVRFRPHFGWSGHIEAERGAPTTDPA